MIDPTSENVALYILANGFCTKCWGEMSNNGPRQDGYYCMDCWQAVWPLGNTAQEYKEWENTTRIWQEALKRIKNDQTRL